MMVTTATPNTEGDHRVAPESGTQQLPVVSPTPQSMSPFSRSFHLPAAVSLVTGANTDPAALARLRDILHAAGVTQPGQRPAGTPPTDPNALDILVGGMSEGNTDSDAVLRQLGVTIPAGLPSGGYVLAAGFLGNRPVVVLDGVDAVGTFYAVQTFRQLIQPQGANNNIPGVQIRDWPSFVVRGGEESFFGDPWPLADVLHQIDFLAAHKMNRLLYTAANDPRTVGGLWRSPYPPDQLAQFAQIVAHAQANHVDFMYRIDPEAQNDPAAGICHSDPNDLQALLARYEQLWSIGIRTMSVGWDDDTGQFVCAADTTTFGADVSPLAAAQAFVVNHVYTNFILTHPGSSLVTVSSEYHGDQMSTYRSRFSELIPPQVHMFWTGPQVVSPTITRSDLDLSSQAFGGRQLLIFDNYPVNDYSPLQQHLAPLVGRDPHLAGAAEGIMANEMQQEEPSLISLFTIADYAWNAAAYDPQRSWTASLAEFGGPGAAALRVYAENSVDSPLNTGQISPAQPAIATFLQAYTAIAPVDGPGAQLTNLLRAAADAPAAIRAHVANPAFLSESSPWLDKLAAQANAGLTAVAALLAQTHGDRATVTTDRATLTTQVANAKAIPQIVAPGVYERLTGFALAETARFLSPTPTTVTPLAARVLLGAGTTNTVSFTLVGLAPGNLQATVQAQVPTGWQATPVQPTISLHSQNRTVTTTLQLQVTPPASAVGTTTNIGIVVAVQGQNTITATVPATVAAVPTTAYPDLVLASHPVGYWRLDDTTNHDSSGHNHDGQDVPPVTHNVPGVLTGSTDTAVLLNGGYINVPTSTDLSITGPFTLEAWIHPNVSGIQQAIVEKYDRPAPNGYIIRIADNGVLNAFVNGPTTLSLAVGATVLTPNQWHHTVSVYDGTTLTIYLNGFADGQVAVTQPPGAGTDDVRLGARGDDTAFRLQGNLDEVAIYPAALTIDQIRQHYLVATVG